jgi:hypothetical protein
MAIIKEGLVEAMHVCNGDKMVLKDTIAVLLEAKRSV